MSAREPLTVPASPQARMRAGNANCRFCGKAWFGDVAYCPYCGHPSAGAPTVPPAAEQEPGSAAIAPAARGSATARAPRPGTRWKAAWITAMTAIAFVTIAIAMKDLAVTTGDTAGLQSAAPAPAFADTGSRTSPASERVAAQRAAPASPAPHRSLCSPANEAAGLCNSQ